MTKTDRAVSAALFGAVFGIFLGTIGTVSALDLFSHRQGNRPEIFEGGDLSAIRKTYPKSSLLQQEMMDFSDRYTTAVWQALDEYLLTENDPAKRLAAEQWKVLFSAASMEIASERETSASLLDMAVFMNLSDWSVRNYWVPEVFGPAGQPLVAANRQMKKDLDAILSGALSPAQRDQLEGAITAWKQEHPKSRSVADVRLRDIASVRVTSDRKNGVFFMLADLRNTLGRVDEAFQYGERMMFYVGRLSRILTMQTSLTIAQTGASPPIMALSRSAAASGLEKLPGTISTNLLTNVSTIQGLLPGIQASLSDTKALAESLERIQKTSHENPGGHPWTPDKTVVALASLEGITRELNGTLQQLHQFTAGGTNTGMPVAQLVNEVHAKTRDTIEDVFQKALILVGVLLLGFLLLLIAAARLFRKENQR